MRRSPVEAVITSVVTTLRASTGLTDLVGTRVYNNVPQGTVFPYVEVSSPTDRRVDTCGRFGGDVTLDIKAVSQALGDQEADRILSQIEGALHFQVPGSSGHSIRGCVFEHGERYREVVNGIVTRHHVGSFRIWTEQSTS